MSEAAVEKTAAPMEEASKPKANAPAAGCACSKPSAERTDRNQEFSLDVKAEYVVEQRPSSLGELPEPPPMPRDDRDDPRNHKRGKKKQRGKKRPRDVRTPNCMKVCLAVVRGDECPYGDSCRFSHDLKAFLKNRPEDIVTCLETCPNFQEAGFCLFGAMCRLGSCHVIKSTGENLRKEGVQAPPIQNILPKEVLIQLRKRVYPFKCPQKQGGKTRNHEMHNKEKKKYGTQQEEDKKEKEEDKGSNYYKREETAETSKDKKEEETETAKEEKTTEVEEKKEATEPFKPINDPFRPSMKAEKYQNPTALPTKTKRIIDFSNKVYVAPLTTVGNLPFRRIMKKFGADITCGEMAVAGNLLEGKPSEWALLKRHPEEDVFGVQIASGYPDQFTRVAEVIETHLDVDFVDMNLGCPLDIICTKGAGASLMLRHNRLKGILSGVTSTLSCPVTVKMRTGWDTGKPFAHQLVSRIQSWGMDGIGAIMIHGRSRLQRYQNLADWDYISTVCNNQTDDLPKLHIIGNGDILSFTDYEERTSKEGISSAAMLGRGALIKPWLPTEIKERRHWDISATERLDILKDFVRFGLTHWGSDQQGVDNTRRFLLEWLSFLCRYVPVGILEGGLPQKMNLRPPPFVCGRSDLETLMLSPHSHDWIKIAEMLLGPVPEGFRFEPKHKARSYK